MNDYLLIDKEDAIPLTRVIAQTKEEALWKTIKGLVEDKILTVEDICESLSIELREITDMTTYE
jgi:hypothetical protein